MVDDDETVQRLLQLGADVNAPAPGMKVRDHHHYDSRTALQWSAENGNFELCQVLMEAGANINATPATEKGITTLAAAVSSNNYRLAELLLKNGAEVNDQRGENTALETAAKLNDIRMTRLPPLTKADPRLANSVIAAVQNRNYKLISTLLKAGADINKTPRAGTGALRVATKMNDSGLVRFLLGAGANPNSDSPLTEAARLGNLEMIEILLRAGADCNHPERGSGIGILFRQQRGKEIWTLCGIFSMQALN